MNKTALFQDIGFVKPPQPYWLDSTPATDYPTLDRDVQVDVAIVGGGLVGITSAYLLKQAGLKVAVVEADRIAQGTTGHTTAKLTSQHDLFYSKLIKQMGQEKAQQYAEANEQAINFVEQLVQEREIECDFSRQAAYIYTQSEQYIQQIQQEVQAAQSLGIKAVYLEQIPLPFAIKAAERFDNQAQFHPRKFTLNLAKGIAGEGSYIFEQSRVVDLHEGKPCTIITEQGKRVTAEQVIIASHFPFYGGYGFYFARMYAERSYALGIITKEQFPGGMYISAESPTRSLRATPLEEGELVIIAGENHRTGEGTNTNLHYKHLIDFAKQTYQVIETPYRWSTQDYTTLDEVPYVGLINPSVSNIYLATGFRKWGMTNGVVSARLITDLICKGESPWAGVYDPSRFEPDPMLKNLVTTNLDVAKHLIGDKLKPVPKDVQIDIGEASVIERDGEKLGLYKDEKGRVHAVDITCTHMGCDLIWNTAELSWDCPCHASRFTYEGEIIEGPALKTLRTDDQFKFNP